jgi:hypothetical protein
MGALQSLGFAMGVAFASGLNLYATVATLGLLDRFGVVDLPGGLEVLAHPLVLGIAILMYVVEFFADKIPYVDSVWDFLHSFIRPPAAALLAYAAVYEVSEPWRIAAALLAGTVALTSHGTKASTRAAVQSSPEPVSNWVLSLLDDGLAVGIAALAVAYPIPTLIVVTVLLVFCLVLLVLLFRFLRGIKRRLTRSSREPSPTPEAT